DVDRETAEHVREDLLVFLEILVHGIGDGVAAPVAAVVTAAHCEKDQLLRILDWEEAQQNLVEQSEDSGVGSDAEGEGKYGDQSEARAAPEGAESIVQVAKQGSEPGEAAHWKGLRFCRQDRDES